MNKIYKFRVWNTKTKNWETHKLQFDDQYCHQSHARGLFVPDYCILQEFTGLTDINHDQIFEGDVVKCFSKISPVGWVNEVKWNPKGAWNIYQSDNMSPDCYATWEIIGNIAENPELKNLISKY